MLADALRLLCFFAQHQKSAEKDEERPWLGRQRPNGACFAAVERRDRERVNRTLLAQNSSHLLSNRITSGGQRSKGEERLLELLDVEARGEGLLELVRLLLVRDHQRVQVL